MSTTATPPAGWLDDYFRRLELTAFIDAKPEPTLQTLFTLHREHLQHIPFENFDTLTGIAPSIVPVDVIDKFIMRRRGGYCFEQATLFREVLRALGFNVYTMVGRMHYGRPSAGPRCHGVIAAIVDGESYLCDVGFSGLGMLDPLPLVCGVEHEQYGDRYLLTPTPRIGWLLQRKLADESAPPGWKWLDLYSFQPEESIEIDFEHGNFFTAHYPKSPFLLITMLGLMLPDKRVFIRGKSKIESAYGSGKETVTPFASLEDLMSEIVALTGMDQTSSLFGQLRDALAERWDTMP